MGHSKFGYKQRVGPVPKLLPELLLLTRHDAVPGYQQLLFRDWHK